MADAILQNVPGIRSMISSLTDVFLYPKK